MKRILLGMLLTLAVSMALLAASVLGLGTNDALMLGLMERTAPPETTGLPAEEYPGMARMITSYLRGGTEDFQYAYTVNGSECLAFSEREQTHMADVRDLFRLCGNIGLCAGAVMVAAWLLMGRNAACRAIRNGLLTVLALVALIAMIAAIDFNALFLLFHRVAFTNDLWLLNPHTDLLIRLMPTDFFVAYAALIGLTWFTALALVLLLTHLLAKERNK